MSFKFNFNVVDYKESAQTMKDIRDVNENSCEESIVTPEKKVAAHEVFPSSLKLTALSEISIGRISIGTANRELLFFKPSDNDKAILLGELCGSTFNPDLLRTFSDNTDLVPSVYEGGFKVWECAVDLVRFLFEKSSQLQLKGKKVLEVGCGVGLPGILAATLGAEVHFQDFNGEVLRLVTYPSLELNVNASPCDQDFLTNCRFFAGDWEKITQLLLKEAKSSSRRYDVILSSETIYNKDAYEKLHGLMSSLLEDTGVVYLAAKTFYFGVGGGTREFEEFVRQEQVFESSVCFRCDEGISREILKLTRKPSS